MLSCVHIGADNGLELVLNAEDYDNMVGPHSSSGVKVVLHQKAEVPMPEYGNELPTGRHGYVDVRVSKVCVCVYTLFSSYFRAKYH